MDNWLPAHRDADGNNGAVTRWAIYTRDDIPFQYALAEAFTICDDYHCSVLGPTWPNRLYLDDRLRSTRGRAAAALITTNAAPERLPLEDLPRGAHKRRGELEGLPGGRQLRLQHAGACSTLPERADEAPTLYQSGMRAVPAGPVRVRRASTTGCRRCRWIIPTSYQSEHPDYIPAAGADFVASKIDAIAANPDVWAEDGVHPQLRRERRPLRPRRAAGARRQGRPSELRRTELPIGGGFRVPCIIVSPWTVGRLGRQRDLRPHVGAAVPRAVHRRARSQHHRLAALRPSAT